VQQKPKVYVALHDLAIKRLAVPHTDDYSLVSIGSFFST